MTDLQPPPRSLRGFPVRSLGRPAHLLYRIFWHRNPDGELNSPWHFTSNPPGANRFDIGPPAGTCYWSDRAYGCWVEVFRRVTLVDERDVTRRRLFVATHPPIRLADVTSLGAYRFGVTAELSTIDTYDLPHRWAEALHRVGFDGILATCRHDPSSRARNVAVFGPQGSVRRRAGWRVARHRIERHPDLLADLARLGVRILPVPSHVSTVAPPS